MYQGVKTKNKKMKDKQQQDVGGVVVVEKTPTKRFRLSFRGRSKKDKTKPVTTKGEGDDDAPNNVDNNRLFIDADNSAKYRYQNGGGGGGGSGAKVMCGTIWEDTQNQNQCDINENASQIVGAILDDLVGSVFLSGRGGKVNPLKCEINALVQEKCDGVQLGKHSMLIRRKTSEQSPDKQKKISHRRTAIIINDPYSLRRDLHRRDSLYSVEEFDENMDENDNRTPHSGNRFVQAVNKKLVESFIGKPRRNHSESMTDLRPTVKKTKSFSLKAFFGRPHKTPEEPSQRPAEVSDATTSRNLVLSRKYSSTTDLSADKPKLMRTPSFIKKKLAQFVHNDGPLLLKRSMSVRDLGKKSENKSREKLTEMKNLEWAQSRQSLLENDNCVSYEDMSFIDYDQFNTVTYEEPKKKSKHLQRTQSLIVHGSPGNYKSGYARGHSAPEHYQSAFDISEQSEALSLPSLCHIIKENDENVFDIASTHRYQRRPQSTCSEDGRTRVRGNGSFRSAGSGCSKLKRTNACRQKSRDNLPLFAEQPGNNQTVRSRSLNHLDTLEMRYGTTCAADAALKDSRSEPDCTKPLSVPPDTSIPEPASPTVEASPGRRHTFSRSQKSSSECFSVNFEVGDELTWDTELIFPAARGVTLHDSLAKLCELRSVDLSSCDAWLQDKESGAHTWLSFSQDTASLVGRHVRITAQDLSNKKPGSLHGTHSRKLSGNYRPRTSNSYFSSSGEEGGAPPSSWAQDARLAFQDLDGSKKGTKQRWSGLFGNNKDTRMELLIDHLNSYTKHGVPSSQIYPQGQCESLDALYKLEGDWREIISCEELNERQQQQQTALWELIKTEVAYIKTLKVVTDLFLACLKNLQSANLLKEIDTEKLFSNITEILDTNVLFWRNSLFPLVRDMRTYRQPPCIENMLGGFINIQDKFCAYFRYCAEQARCQHYCRENHAHNELFTAYLVWCETQKECNRLRLMDILVQPMQRLTKYGLLLKAILRNTDEEVERDSLTRMIKSVDEFVNNVNHSLKQKQDNERLRGIIARIESYDIVESKDDDLDKLLKSHCHLDLNRPMLNCPPERKRHLLLEGDLKLKDGGASKMEVHCFLLTDMLLVCKPSTKKGGATMRVIRQPYLVDRLIVTELNRETPSLALVYMNEFDMAIAAFILQNNDATILKSWKKGIAKAQALYAQAKQPSYMEESLDYDITFDSTLEGDSHSLQLAPRSPLASSSRASRVSSLAHSHSGSVEMNDQSSLGSGKEHSRAVSIENENRTGSISSDEGVQPLPPDRAAVSQKNSFKHRLFSKTPNTLSVQPYANLGQSLPNLTLGSPNVGTLSLNLNQNTLSVPNAAKNGGQQHLLSPTHRGVSYPPPSPTRGNLRRGLAISQSKNPPLIKTRHVNSTSASTSGQVPASFDFDVPVIAGVLTADQCENFSRGQHRQAMMKRLHRNDNKRYYTAGVVDDIKRNDNRDVSIHKRLSWNCTSQEVPPLQEDRT